MIDLDDATLIHRVDPGGMRALIARLPEQARRARDEALAWSPPPLRGRPRRIVLLGMGGSAIGADIVSAYLAQRTPLPVQLVRGYTPPLLDASALVVGCSFSGETEETVAAYEAAGAAGAQRAALTAGGRLARIAEVHGEPVLRYAWEGPPRSALGYGVFGLLGLLERLSAIEIDGREIDQALAALSEESAALQPEVPESRNRAKQIARRLHGGAPVIVGCDFLEAAARRWAGQVAENAKSWAFAAALPEVNHNLILGFDAPAMAVDALRVVLLEAPGVHERTRLRVPLTGEELSRAGVAWERVTVAGDDPLEALMRACVLGDWVSFYLAALAGVDPLPMVAIERLKQRLARPID